MSLINKVLRDLDARSTSRGPDGLHPNTVHHGLRPPPPMSSTRRGLMTPLLLVLVLIAVSYVAISYWFMPLPYWPEIEARMGIGQTPVRVAAVEPKPVPTKDEIKELTADETPAVSAEPQATGALPGPMVEKEMPAVASPPATKPAPPVAKKPEPVARSRPKTAPRPKPARVQARPAAVAAAPTRAAEGDLKKNVKPVSPGASAENAYREGVLAMEQGNSLLAEEKFRETLRYNARHARASELLAGLMISAGRASEGEQVLEQALRQSPGQRQLSNLLARFYVDQGNDGRALVLLEQAQKANPGDAGLMSFRAALYQRQSRHTDAARVYQEALTIKPAEGAWWIGLGISLEALQDPGGAGTAYQQALATPLNPRLAQYARQRLDAVKHR